MDIGELVSVAVAVEQKDDCWYCKEEKKKEGPKSKLARGDVAGLLNKKQKKANLSWTGGKYGAMHAEAHHLISVRPMADAENLHPYIECSHGKIEEDIGYDLNHPNNSVWMPGRPVPKKETDMIAVIKESNAQIHNSGHPDYRSNVFEILEELFNKIKKDDKDKKCPLCDEPMESKMKAPYGLVGRLDAISGQLRSLLTGIPSKWLLDEGYYTFSRGKKKMAQDWIANGDLS